jgi:Family of unknown function (DUF6263)
MKYYTVSLVLLLCSCKMQLDASRQHDDNDPKRVYRLRFNPAPGSKFNYTVTRSTEFEMVVDDKEVKNKNSSDMDIVYSVSRDSAGNTVLGTAYHRIHLYSKNGDVEQEEDAEKAEGSADPLERMLGILKSANLRVLVSPAGTIEAVEGDEAVKNQLLAGVPATATYARDMASRQWDQQVKNGLIKRNMEELFRIFPDSAVHVGDRWKLNSPQQLDIPLGGRNVFQLKEIVDGTAVIQMDGEIISSQQSGLLNGTSYTSDLTGKSQGSLEMDTATGMLLKASSESTIKGTISSMGRDIPVKIKISMKMEGRKL